MFIRGYEWRVRRVAPSGTASPRKRPLRNLYAASAGSVWVLDGRGSSMRGMDFVAVALALLAFLALYGLIALVDRI